LPFFQATVDDLRPRESPCVDFFLFLLGHKEKAMEMINLFLCLLFKEKKNPRDKLISLPFFQVTVNDLRPRESLRVEYFFYFF